MFKAGTNSKRFWRPLIAVVLAYALAAQSLLITIGGFAAIAQADTGATAFVLCAHNSEGAPAQPANAPAPGCNHCIFCFAGAHHGVIGSSPPLFERVDFVVIDCVRLVAAQVPPRLSAYSIANPRGPPLRA
jgi:hypothetical protein